MRENPVPETVAELMVSAVLPFEVMVSVCVVGLAMVTFPKAIDDELSDMTADVASSCNETVLLTPAAEAVRVTV